MIFSLLYQNYIDTFDKIILDAPCSGSGMFRKSDLVKMDWTFEKGFEVSRNPKKINYYRI